MSGRTVTQMGAFLRREMLLGWRGRGESAGSLVFVLLIVTLFPFALGPDAQTLQRLAPGLLLMALLLGQMLGFERLFESDYREGTLDILSAGGMPLALYALGKAMAQWCALLLPVLLVSPLLMLLLHVDAGAMPALLGALALASLAIQLLGMLGAALTLGARRAGLLLPLLLIPFYIPVMIFAVSMASGGNEAQQAGDFLGALFFVYLAVLPFLSGKALRAAIEGI